MERRFLSYWLCGSIRGHNEYQVTSMLFRIIMFFLTKNYSTAPQLLARHLRLLIIANPSNYGMFFVNVFLIPSLSSPIPTMATLLKSGLNTKHSRVIWYHIFYAHVSSLFVMFFQDLPLHFVGISGLGMGIYDVTFTDPITFYCKRPGETDWLRPFIYLREKRTFAFITKSGDLYHWKLGSSTTTKIDAGVTLPTGFFASQNNVLFIIYPKGKGVFETTLPELKHTLDQ